MSGNMLVKIGATAFDSSDWELPNDRTFREAWEPMDGERGVIGVDMTKAREIWRMKIRQARKPLFESLDAEFMRCLEDGVSTAEIVRRKKDLRDATKHPDIDGAKTPEELKRVKPCGLELE